MVDRSLPYHFALDYGRNPSDRPVLPRVSVTIELFPGQTRFVTIRPVLDTGAQVSVFDGSAAIDAGWTTNDIVERATGSMPIYGIGSGPPIASYLHEVTAFIGTFDRYAQLKLHVLITMPGQLPSSVLGRTDFFEQVDVTFAEIDKRLYFHFRDPSVLRNYP